MRVVIFGAGKIGLAACVLLLEPAAGAVEVRVVDADADALERTRTRVGAVPTGGPELRFVRADLDVGSGVAEALAGATVAIDATPGRLAERVAYACIAEGVPFVNLTEHVAASANIARRVAGSGVAAVLQSGLAPGFIDVLGLHELRRFQARDAARPVAHLGLRVGALTLEAPPPAYYAWSWSPAGVATEYVRPARVLRAGRPTELPSLSERETVVVAGFTLEADLTSGGAADLTDALADEVLDLEYKTLRFPGHYAWVDRVLAGLTDTRAREDALEAAMHRVVRWAKGEDMVVLQVVVRGMDTDGRWCTQTRDLVVPAFHTGTGHRLSAIQATTAAPAVAMARALGAGRFSGLVLQSRVPAELLLGDPVVRAVYRLSDGS